MSRRGWLVFAAMCLVWGIPYLLIRVAVREIEPGTLVFLRTGLGGLVLLPLAVRQGGLPRVVRHWRALLAFTTIEIAGPWYLLSDAERHLTSSLSGLLIAAVPLVGVAVAPMFGTTERVTLARLAGLGLGMAGVAVLVGLDLGSMHSGALVEMAAVVLGYAIAPIIMARHLSHLPGLSTVCASLLLAALGYLPYAALNPPRNLGGQAISSVLVLGVVCTAAAFVLFFALIGEIGPTRATVFTYVNPAIAMLAGVTLLGETFTVGMAVGFPLILLGSVLAARGPRPLARAIGSVGSPAPEPPPPQSTITVPEVVPNVASTSPDPCSSGTDHSTSTPSSRS